VRVVLIPAKALSVAKTRLGKRFSDAQRRALARAMYLDVLEAALAARSPDRVAVVSSEAEMLSTAREMGAIALDERFPRGLNAAVKFATAHLAAAGARELAVVLSDIPLVTPDDIDAMFEAAQAKARCVVLTPSREGTGTNMVLRRPPDVIKTRFGPRSLARHIGECRLAGVEQVIFPCWRAALDLDRPEDIAQFIQAASAGHTFRELTRLGLLGD